MAERKITRMPNGDIKFRQHVYIELPEDVYERFNAEASSNLSAFFTKLIVEHYDKNIVKVPIDEKIRNAYENDIFKDYRLGMLLLEFYLKGSINVANNETSISLNDNNNIGEASSEDNNKLNDSMNVIHTSNTINTNDEEVSRDKGDNFEENAIINDENNEESEKLEYNVVHDEENAIESSSDSKGRINEVDISNEINNIVEKTEEKSISNKIESSAPRKIEGKSGSLSDIFKKSNKSIL